MSFNTVEREILLEVKGVGETVIKRLEQIGIDSMEKLSRSSVDEITDIVAALLNTTCWKNSPQAKSAIKDAIGCAQEYVGNG